MGVGGNLKCKAERREKGKRDPENPGAGTQNSAPKTQNPELAFKWVRGRWAAKTCCIKCTLRGPDNRAEKAKEVSELCCQLPPAH